MMTSDVANPDMDDRSLVDCLQAGVNRCFELLVRRLGPKVLAMAKRYLRSDADAADCFQDTFLAVFAGINEFEHRSSLSTWVQGIAINHCLMRIRARDRRKEDSIEHLLPEFDTQGRRIQTCHPDRSCGIGEAIDASAIQALVRGKIGELPDDYRIVLLLRDIDGYLTKETADILGIQVNAVKTRLHRARSALKTLLEPELEF